jgi:hypothetical protein
MSTDLEQNLSPVLRHQILSNELTTVLAKLDQSFSTVLDDVLEHLFTKAESCATNREKQVFLDAYNKVRHQAGEIEQRFKKNFRSLLDESVAQQGGQSSQRGQGAPRDAIDFGELTLVDTDQIDEDVQVRRLTDKIKASVEWELRDLNARMSYLLGRDGAEEADNPLRPELFCKALGRACADMESDHATRLEVLRSFEKALSTNLGSVYHDLNARLISCKVLPKVRHLSAARRPAPRGASSFAGHMGDAERDAAVNERIGSAVEHVVESTLSMFEALQKLVSNAPAYRNSLGIATEAGLPAGHSRRNLLSAIQELRNAQDVGFDLGSLQQGVTQNLVPNFIWANHNQLSAAASNNVDRMKIDIVAMLFDHILADDKLPAEFKTLLGRLQLPVLRVALSDETFFATRAHPTRRLIDRIASCAVGYDGEGDASRRFFLEVERIVMAVLRNVDDESSTVYERMLTEFEYFIEREHTQSNDIVGRAAGVLERAEIREVLGINATIQVNQLLYGVALEPFLKAFLLDVWTHVLVEAACRTEDSATDPTFQRFKQLCLDLVWSAQPKSSPEDRRRLVALLPKMIGCIREGLALIGYPPEQETRFFAELMQLHSAAVRAPAAFPGEQIDIDRFADRLREMVVASDVTAVAGAAEVKLSPQSARRVTAEAQGEVELLDVPTGPEPSGLQDALPSDALVMAWIDSLERGSWYELRVEGNFNRVRLAWISPLRSFYLFIAAHGEKAHSLDPDALRKALRNGDLRSVESETLVDRAVRGVMDNLGRQQAGGERSVASAAH